LLLAFPAPSLRLPPSVPAFPLRPLPRLLPAIITAVARHRMRWPKTVLASFQQTLPAPRSTRSTRSLLPVGGALISMTSWWILAGAHGRARSRTAQVSEGIITPLRGASQFLYIEPVPVSSRTLPKLRSNYLPSVRLVHQNRQIAVAPFSATPSVGTMAPTGPPKWPTFSLPLTRRKQES
jgi:hypothetical protein